MNTKKINSPDVSKPYETVPCKSGVGSGAISGTTDATSGTIFTG